MLTEKKLNLIWILIIGILCLSVVERTGITLGVITMGYALLYWQRPLKDRLLLFMLGLTFVIFSLIILKFYLNNNDYNSFLANIGSNFKYPGFTDKLKIFLLFNIIYLGLFALFDWRAFLLALVVMGPNILGNIGGAEKIGWLTHYHSIYFPFLVYAAAAGFIKLSNIMNTKLKQAVLFSSTLILTVLVASTYLYAGSNQRFSFDYIKDNAWVRTGKMLFNFYGKRENSEIGYQANYYKKIQTAIPKYSIITTTEGFMTALYKNRTVYYYPIGLDVSDYAILPINKEPDGRIIYMGAVSYLGQDNLRKLNICLNERMKKAGYDLENPLIIGNTAILRRAGSIKPYIQ